MSDLSRMKLGGCLLGLLVGAVLLVGCGGGEDQRSEKSTAAAAVAARPEILPTPACPRRSKLIRVTLDGRAGPENVGILMAEQQGFFREAGLAVRVESPASPNGPVPDVTAGKGHLGVGQQPQIVLGRDEGAQLIGIASIVSQPTEAMIWLPGSGIDGLADLRGKTIAFPGVPFQKLFLERILARAGLGLRDVKLKRVGYGLAVTLLSGKADAIFGGSWNLEGTALRAHGAHPVITKVGNLGIPGYDESVLFAPFECVYERPTLYRKLVAAVARGTRAAVKDPAAAAQAIERDSEADPTLGRGELEAQLQATLPLLSRDGVLSPARIALLSWMKNQGMIEDKWPFATIFTNYYLG